MIGVLSNKLKTRRIMKKMMFVFAAALMMVACSNEEVAVNDDVKYVTELKLNFGSGDSRIAATHDPASGLKFAWEGDDEINIFLNEENQSLSFYYKYDATSGTFKPKSESYKMEAGKSYFAVMRPNSVCNVTNIGTADVQVGLNLDNNISMKTLPLISDVFTADAGGTIATMYHLVGMVEIPVKLGNTATYTTVEQFTLYASGGKLADSFTAKPMSPYIKDTSTGYDTAYENGGPYTLSTSSTTTVFIPVLPGTYSDAKLNYFYNETSKQVNLGSITVERGKITKVDDTTVNPN